jgi:3alpha(or 20beta)-hydroxysteroid dehydrogenase
MPSNINRVTRPGLLVDYTDHRRAHGTHDGWSRSRIQAASSAPNREKHAVYEFQFACEAREGCGNLPRPISEDEDVNGLEGKVAIVTGAARGTGAAIAERFCREGAHVVLGDVLHERGEETAASLGARASFHVLDVTNSSQWSATVEHTLDAHERIDVLVNNAGVLHQGPIANTSEADFRRLLEVNTLGPFLGIKAVVPAMQAQGAGSIVNVGSIDSLAAMNGLTAYCASKFGLRGLAKAAALETGRDGIRVNTVCPAGGNPEMFAPWMNKVMGFLDETIAYNADRGIPGSVPVESIVDAIVFLASDASRHCTGIDLPVDGGATAGCFIPGFNTL